MVSFCYSKEKQEKKTKHGSVLRHVVLKSVSAQMVSASVSTNILPVFISSIKTNNNKPLDFLPQNILFKNKTCHDYTVI